MIDYGFGGWRVFFCLLAFVASGLLAVLHQPVVAARDVAADEDGQADTSRKCCDTSKRTCWVWLPVGLNFGGNFALFPSATADYFGTKNLGMNYGWIFTAYGVAGILGPAVGGVLFDATQDYILAFLFAGVLCFLAAACSIVVWALSRRPVDGAETSNA